MVGCCQPTWQPTGLGLAMPEATLCDERGESDPSTSDVASSSTSSSCGFLCSGNREAGAARQD
jgi:hypothetical protein